MNRRIAALEGDGQVPWLDPWASTRPHSWFDSMHDVWDKKQVCPSLTTIQSQGWLRTSSMTITIETPRQADDRLMKRIASREGAAFEEFVDAHTVPIVRTVFKIIRNKAIADEVVQDVLLEAWKFAHRYHPELGSARTWVTVIAHRRAVDRVRSEVSATRWQTVYMTDLDLSPVLDPADVAVISEDQAHLHHALRSLTDAQRTVLVLAYFYGHTQAEMAVLLRVPLGTVKTRVRDGLKNLRRLI